MTGLNINQFAMVPVQGDLDLQIESSVISVIVDSTQATALVAGAAVKLVDSATPLPSVVGLAANTDTTFGFIVRTLKDISFTAGKAVEVALSGSVMQMTSGGAIGRGASVEVNYSANTVITSGGSNPTVGFALDKATGSGQLIRVYVSTHFSATTIGSVTGLQTALNAKMQQTQISVTQAQLNAGQVLVPGVAGKSITVTDIQATFTGTFAAGTAMVVESTNGTPVVVDTLVLAGMTGFQRLPLPTAIDAHQTPGAGAGAPLGVGDGLQVVHTGSAFTGGTAINMLISYTQQ